MVHRRRRGQDPWPSGDDRGGDAAGQDQAPFAPHIDMGDFVIVVNAEKIVVTGKKETQKFYYRHSGYPGGLTAVSLKQMRAAPPGAHHRSGRPRHAAEECPRRAAVEEAQSLRRSEASACGPESGRTPDRDARKSWRAAPRRLVNRRQARRNIEQMADKQAATYFYGTGRRKTAVARVRLYPGTGEITVNGKTVREYFGGRDRTSCRSVCRCA